MKTIPAPLLLLIFATQELLAAPELNAQQAPSSGDGRAAEAKLCHLEDFARLPKRIFPTTHKLIIRLNQEASGGYRSFDGAAQIDLLTRSQTNNTPSSTPANWIVLHAGKHLTVSDVCYQKLAGRSSDISLLDQLHSNQSSCSEVGEVCRDFDNELLVVKLNETVARRARVLLKFGAKIQDNPAADEERQSGPQPPVVFQQTNCNGTWNLNTQLGPEVRARHLFPCFDEPGFKIRFKLSLLHGPNLTAISNAAESEEPKPSSSQRDAINFTVFAETQPIPAHRLAFAVGKFKFSERLLDRHKKRGQIRLRFHVSECLASSGLDSKTELALEMVKDVLHSFEAFSSPIEYPAGKLDLLIGKLANRLRAQSNFGLIIFDAGRNVKKIEAIRSTKRYWSQDPELWRLDNWAQIKWVRLASEMVARQILGNLRSADWWNDLWLQEAFAHQLSYGMSLEKGLRADPVGDFNEKEWLAADNLRRALGDERPVVGERGEQFSSQTSGHERTTAILGLYLDTWPWFGTAKFDSLGLRPVYNEEALFDSFKRADAGRPEYVLEDARLWLEQPGYPLLKLKLINNGSQLLYEQARFALNGSGEAESSSDGAGASQLWPIPVWLDISCSSSFRVFTLMNERNATKDMGKWCENATSSASTSLRVVQNGFNLFRVFYSDELLESLVSAEKSRKSSDLEHYDLYDNEQALIAAGYIRGDQLARRQKLFDTLPRYNSTWHQMIAKYATD